MIHVDETNAGGGDFASRLREAIGHHQVKSIAKAAKISEAVMHRYLARQSEPTRPVIVRIAIATGADVGWLVSGHRPKDAASERARIVALAETEAELVRHEARGQTGLVSQLAHERAGALALFAMRLRRAMSSPKKALASGQHKAFEKALAKFETSLRSLDELENGGHPAAGELVDSVRLNAELVACLRHIHARFDVGESLAAALRIGGAS